MLNKRMTRALLAGLCLASVSAASMTAAADDETLTVQFVPTNNDGTMEAKAEPFAEYLSEKLGMEVKVTLATDYTMIIEAMASGQLDVGIMPLAAIPKRRSWHLRTSPDERCWNREA